MVTYDTLEQTYTRFADHGFSLEVVGARPPVEKRVVGQPGRDKEVGTVKQLLQNMMAGGN